MRAGAAINIRKRRTNQSITLEVTNAVHALEQAKLSIEASKVALDLAQKSLSCR